MRYKMGFLGFPSHIRTNYIYFEPFQIFYGFILATRPPIKAIWNPRLKSTPLTQAFFPLSFYHFCHLVDYVEFSFINSRSE